MPTYIVLASFTDKGVHDVKDTVGRADKFKDMAKKAGVTVRDMYWTLGPTDVVTICEAPDDESATSPVDERRRARLCAHADAARVQRRGDRQDPGPACLKWLQRQRGAERF